jgi:hypothetical protein
MTNYLNDEIKSELLRWVAHTDDRLAQLHEALALVTEPNVSDIRRPIGLALAFLNNMEESLDALENDYPPETEINDDIKDKVKVLATEAQQRMAALKARIASPVNDIVAIRIALEAAKSPLSDAELAMSDIVNAPDFWSKQAGGAA